MVQVNYTNIWHGKIQYWLPYSVGCLVAQARSVPELDDAYDFDFIFKRENPADVVAKMDKPDVVCFSMYVWNENYQMALSNKIKEKWPDVVIVFGGPSALQKHIEEGCCDVLVDGEGELTFVEIMHKMLYGEDYRGYYDVKRITDLTCLASPYCDEIFGDVVKRNPELKWMGTLETDRGCPYQCTFCDWGGLIQAKIKKFDMDRVTSDIDWMARNHVVYVVAANANFGIFPDRDIYTAQYIRDVADEPWCEFETINFQFLKNNSETSMIINRIMGDLTKGVTLSRQSNDADVLEAIKRKNISAEKFGNVVKLSEDYGVTTYTEFILPLPLETIDTWKTGLASSIEQGQNSSIDVWPATLLPKSEMGQPEYIEKYGIKYITAKGFLKNNTETEDYDDNTTAEETKIVVSTSTMSTEDVKQAYLFAWFINRYHYCGYSQIISRYLYDKHGVPVLDFYNKLFDTFRNTERFAYVFGASEKFVTQYLYDGTMLDLDDPELHPKMGLHFVMGMSRAYFYNRKEDMIGLALEIGRSFAEIPDDIEQLQRTFVYDESIQYPVVVEADYDIINHKDRKVRYVLEEERIEMPIKRGKATDSDNATHRLRRYGFRCFISIENEREVMSDELFDRIDTAVQKAQSNIIAIQA